MTKFTISIDIPDIKTTAFMDALAAQNGYTEMIEDDQTGELKMNPVTKNQWIKNWVLSVIRASWVAWNNAEAKRVALEAQAETGDDITVAEGL